MRTAFALYSLAIISQASASWFSSDPEWKDWSESQLADWLDHHNVPAPKGYTKDELSKLVQQNWYAGSVWTQKQLDTAKATYDNIKDASFDTWNESQLREFLLTQGIAAPSGPVESLRIAAKKQYWSYNSAVSSLGDAASTAVYGDKAYQASKTVYQASASASSLAATASAAVSSVLANAPAAAQEKLDDSKDYIYSTWTDNELRSYLEKHGAIKSNAQATRDELLTKMKTTYASVADPVWKSWSDSYLFEWLHSRGLVRTDFEKKRDKLTKAAEQYYYGAQDTAYSSWNESELKDWLVAHDVIKSDAQLKKEKLVKLVKDNYASASDTVYGGWRDSDIRDWLINNGYLRSDAQVKREELVQLINEKYNDVTASTASYLTWPNARLRSFLRAHGVDDTYIPSTRPGLLQEVRVRWVQSTSKVDSLVQRIRDAISSSVDTAEEQLSSILDLLTGQAKSVSSDASSYGKVATKSAKSAASSVSAKAEL